MKNRKAWKSKQTHNGSLGNSMTYTCRELAIEHEIENEQRNLSLGQDLV